MDFHALKVLQDQVEKLAGDLMQVDLADLHDLEAIVEQIQSIAVGASAQGLSSEADSCLQLIDRFRSLAGEADGTFEADLNHLVQLLQEVLGSGTVVPAAPAPRTKAHGTSGWDFCLSQMPHYVDVAILTDFIENLEGVLDDFQHLLLALDREFQFEKVAELRRLIHTVKSDAGLLGQKDVERLCHRAEDLLRIESLALPLQPLFLTWDWLKRRLDWVATGSDAPEPPDTLMEILREAILDTENSTAPLPTGTAPLPVGSASSLQTDSLPEWEDGFFSTAPVAQRMSTEHFRFVLGDAAELLDDFLVEAAEITDNLDVLILRLQDPESGSTELNAVFRAFHTLKGLSGFFAIDPLRRLANQCETMLDQFRKVGKLPDSRHLDLLFACNDEMKRIAASVTDARQTGQIEVLLEWDSRLESLSEVPGEEDLEPERTRDVPGPDERPIGQILQDHAVLDEKSLAAALEEQSRQRHPLIGEILVEQGMVSKRLIDSALKRQEEGENQPVGTLLIEQRQVNPDDLMEALEIQHRFVKPKLGEVLIRSGQVPASEVRQALMLQNPRSGGSGSAGESTPRENLKVEAHRLDQLVESIGELVIAESMVMQHPDLANQGRSTSLSRLLAQMDRISRNLQAMATDLRLVPIRPVFDKMARLARDLSRKTGKQLQFRMEGEDTRLDKNMVDRIGDPLLHLVRNAVDHGLESDPAVRTAQGKTAAGNLKLTAWQQNGSIWVELADDGKGIDFVAVRESAIRAGMVSPDQELTHRELQQLIFQPGLSTSDKVTDISGRGVGMDVVASTITSLRGAIHLESQPGTGTTFRIQLPLTLAIIEGMLVRAAGQTWVLPTQGVTRLVEPASARIECLIGRGTALSQPEGLVPLMDLATLMGMPSTPGPAPVIIVLEQMGQRFALQVDEVLGQQQVVIKSLGDGLRGIPGISGGCILADGKVGLILDPGTLVPGDTQFPRGTRPCTAPDGAIQAHAGR